MAWIQSYQQLERNPKTKKLMSLTGLDINQVIGLLHRLWWWVLDYAEDGGMTKYSDQEIALNLNCDVKIIRALYDCGTENGAGFIDTDRKIHDWADYAGKYLYSKYHSANPAKYEEIMKKYGKDGKESEERQPREVKPPDPILKARVERIVAYMNKVFGLKRGFDPEGKVVQKYLVARLKEMKGGQPKYTDDDFRVVILFKNKEWNKPPRPGSDFDGRKFLNPETLFRPSHFERYLVEARAAGSTRKPGDDDLGDVARAFKR